MAFVLSWFLKAAPLRAKSALQENADNDAAIAAELAAAEMGSMVAPVAATETDAPAEASAAASVSKPQQ